MAKKTVSIGLSVAVALAVTLGLLVALDRLVADDAPRDLVFPSGSAVEYETFEFKHLVEVSSLGIRGPELPLERSARPRVLALGDSMTFGWGAAIERTWPRRLEELFRARGMELEVANLGQPGTSPVDYADLAERAIPLLRPDLVVVTLTQGDDLAQLREQRTPFVDTKPLPEVRRLGNALFGNLRKAMARGTRRWPGPPVRTRDVWSKEAPQLLARLKPEQRTRYDALDERLRLAFLDGLFNPWIVARLVQHPDYVSATWDLENPTVRPLIDRLAEQLGRIRRAADAVHARVLVASVPLSVYASRASFATYRKMGFVLSPEMLTGDAQDRALAEAAAKVRLELRASTERFRAQDGKTPLFYEYDGHLTPAGNDVYAAFLAPLVESSLGVTIGKR